MSQLTPEEKEDIAIIMRQTECYDVKLLVDRYKYNQKDVLETVCEVMNIQKSTPNDFMPQDQFTEIREALTEKDKMFQDAMTKMKKPK